ncbi:MAG: M24 family metallopeptidase [Chloroflexota bacterium]
MLLNIERARRLMTERGLQALVATSPENVGYLSDYGSPGMKPSNRLGQAYAVLPARPDIPPFLAAPTIDLCLVAQQPTWIEEVRSFGDFYVELEGTDEVRGDLALYKALLSRVKPETDGVTALARGLADRGLDGGRLGIDEAGILPAIWEQIQLALPQAGLTRAYGLFREIRAVKSQVEIERLRRAAAVALAGIAETFAAAREGVSQRELSQIYHTAVAARGAYPRPSAWGCGPGSAWPFTLPHEYRLKAGDLIRCDVGCMLDYYWAGTSRTAVLGSPRPEYRQYYEAVYAAHMAALGTVRAGARAADVFEAGVAAARKGGIPHFRRTHVGHGIGIEAYDEPLITPDSSWILEAGMVINIEPPYYDLGFGGVTVEDTVVVTESSFDFLTPAPRDLYVL